MSELDPRIEEFWTRIKAAGRSSPYGAAWQRFYEFLSKNNRKGQPRPPVPMILAASGESNESKYQRLAAQLEWALRHDCLDEAIHFLEQIPEEQWNGGPPENWGDYSYLRP